MEQKQQLLGRLTRIFLILAGLTLGASQPSQAADPRPNIVLIMCDDMGFSDLGCYGGEIRTPNIDRLAAEGRRFTQFYNCAVCVTTRASLMTGLYARCGRNGKTLGSNMVLGSDMVTIAEVLQSAGYQTAMSGKWHLGNKRPRRPIDRGFDEYYGLMDGCCNFFNPSRPDPPFKGGRVRVFGHNDTLITEFPNDFYTTDAFSDHAVETIRRFAKTGTPFFLHVGYTAPHYPLHAKPSDIARYKGKYMMGWDKLRGTRHRRQVELGLIDPKWKLSGRENRTRPWDGEKHKPWQDLRMAVYAAMIDSMDQGIGRIMQALKEVGAHQNTLVIFLSDNGGCPFEPGGENPSRIPGPKEYYTTCGWGWSFAQNTPFRKHKTWVHEGGIATPMIARWPKVIEPSTITHQVGHVIDLMPTCAEIAGAKYPSQYRGNSIAPVEGKSLVPVLKGKTRKGHDTLYWELFGNRAVRQGKWKLVWDNQPKKWELYDLKADRTETDDLAEKHPKRVKKMSRAWHDWKRRITLPPAKPKQL